jgi:hypothetical protein
LFEPVAFQGLLADQSFPSSSLSYKVSKTMAAMLTREKNEYRSRLPEINLSDIPELMPGALPSANPAARAEFEQCCLQLHAEAVQEAHVRVANAPAGCPWRLEDLISMFPGLDPELVHVLTSDASSPEQAVETLVALSAASAELVVATGNPDIGLGSMELFPSLVDSNGWQVVSQHLLDRDPEQDLGTCWSDRAKAAANKPAPSTTKMMRALAPKQRAVKQVAGQVAGEDREMVQPETEYELRQRLGKQRLHKRNRFHALRNVNVCTMDQDSQSSDLLHDNDDRASIGTDQEELLIPSS